MEKYELQSSDYKLIDELVKITSSIETLYKKMYDLEINDKNDTDEFKIILDYLNIALEVENKIYQDANLNYSRCIALTDFILQKKLNDNFVSDIESIMTQNYDNRVLRRILSILVHKITSDCESIKGKIPTELFDFMQYLGISNLDEFVSDAIYSGIELQKALENDVLNGFLVFLHELINKDKYKNFKEALICTKYNVSFINKNIETDMISNKFNIPETLCINSRFIADLTQTNLELYELLKNSYSVKEATKQISEIIETKDEDYNDSKKMLTSMLRQCLMRASFMLMSDEFISDINYEFHKFIESEEYLHRHPGDSISEQLVVDCFKSVKKDRNKTNVLSYRI